jgi:hypothetical protein
MEINYVAVESFSIEEDEMKIEIEYTLWQYIKPIMLFPRRSRREGSFG